MHHIYTFFRFYPAFAVSVAVVLIQTGAYFQRKRIKARFYFYGMAGVLILTSILWGVFRGDLHSDQWVRSMLQSNP